MPIFKEKIEFGLPFHITYTNCGGDVDEHGCFIYVKRILHGTAGGDVDENDCFPQVKRILRWIVEGDVERLGHFQIGKSLPQCSIFFCITYWGAMLRKLTIFKVGKVVHMVFVFASPLGDDVEKI